MKKLFGGLINDKNRVYFETFKYKGCSTPAIPDIFNLKKGVSRCLIMCFDGKRGAKSKTASVTFALNSFIKGGRI